MDRCTQRVICVATSRGKTHDFTLFKDSRLAIAPSIELLADSGYLGIDKFHSNSQTPHKKSKLHPLTPEQQQNRVPETLPHSRHYLQKQTQAFCVAHPSIRSHCKLIQMTYECGLLCAVRSGFYSCSQVMLVERGKSADDSQCLGGKNTFDWDLPLPAQFAGIGFPCRESELGKRAAFVRTSATALAEELGLHP
jgi:hypothetical protein